jgi:SecY interacting protein Syd
MKRRLRKPDTFFIAVTDEEDFIISVDNASGNVMLEQVGVEPTDILANSLTEFLQSISPEVAKG